MGQLDRISSPADVRRLSADQADELAGEIRTFLVESVSRTGGHLGPNLGVVELTIAMHRVFESPLDTMVFDTGHQAYVHKLLTGRTDFSKLRSRDGLSGYPSRAESEHDVVENSHASTALSWADGIAKANELQGRGDRHVVAVIGDGALTGGMAWEALNNIADGQDRRLVIVVNDNGRSYAPTIGGMAHHLDTLRTTQGYENVLTWGKRTLRRAGPPGRATYDALHGMKKGIKDVLVPQGMFEDLGIKYVGPVDGHDIRAVERSLRGRQGVRRPGHRARHHREGPRLHARRAGRRRPVPRGRPDPPRDRAAAGAVAVRLDRRVRRRDRPDRPSAHRRRRDHRGDAPARRARAVRGGVPRARVRRRHRRAARRDVRRRHGVRRPAPRGRRVRDVPQPRLRPGAHGRGAAQGGRHVRARPRRPDGRRRREPQRHVGHGDARHRARASGSRPRATSRRCAPPCGPRSTSTTHRPWCATPRAPWATRSPRSRTWTASTCSPATTVRPTRRRVLVVGVGSMVGTALGRGRDPRRARAARRRRRPPLGPAGARGADQARRRARPRRDDRGRRRRRRDRRARRSAGRARPG